MFAAVIAARKGHDVTVIEKNKRPCRKLMITGKGRCNLTNLCGTQDFISNIVSNPRFLYSAINSFGASDTMDFFESCSVPLKVERGNRVFPISDKAVDIVDALVNSAKKSGCKIICDTTVNSLIVNNNHVTGIVCGERKFFSDMVIICTGGLSYPLTGSTGDGYKLASAAGHTIKEPKASLVPLVEDGEICSKMQGLSLKNISIKVFCGTKNIFEDFGELLFTHFGLSGPVILSASGHMRNIENKKYTVSIDLKPALSEQQLDTRIQKDFLKYSNRDFVNSLDDLLPQKMIEPFVKYTKIPIRTKANQITKQMRNDIIGCFKDFRIPIKGFRPIDEAIITSGGISVGEIDPKTMESKLVKGLHFAGEIIDTDAYTGGFNLQIAFSTAFSAANN